MTEFLTSLLSNLWAIFLVVFFFGGSIFVHELGHFLAARRRGVHVERFSIGFGPAIWKFRGRDGVEYRLSWIPLGGYVLLPQLADLGPVEGESATDVSKLPPVSYASKMLVFAAGATFNVIFAFLLACIIWVVGQPTIARLTTNRIGAVATTIELPDKTSVPSPAHEAGLRAGDRIVAVDGAPVRDFEEILSGIVLGKGWTEDKRRKVNITVEREGTRQDIIVYPQLVGDDPVRTIGVEPAEDLTVSDFTSADAPAARAGLKRGDQVIAVDGQPVYLAQVVSEYVATRIGQPIEFLVRRDGVTLPLRIAPVAVFDPTKQKEVGRIGVSFRRGIVILHPNPFAQIGKNIEGTFTLLGALLSPKSDVGPRLLQAPLGIGQTLYDQAQWDIRRVLWFTILLNVSLAIFNLLPIPVLDGGHMLFATIARLRGKPLPVNFIVTTQSVFMVLFLMMFVYVTIQGDIPRTLRRFRAAEAAEVTTPAK